MFLKLYVFRVSKFLILISGMVSESASKMEEEKEDDEYVPSFFCNLPLCIF